ncbi:hypothetical protein QTP88_019031 [Uroleucon formosanum]
MTFAAAATAAPPSTRVASFRQTVDRGAARQLRSTSATVDVAQSPSPPPLYAQFFLYHVLSRRLTRDKYQSDNARARACPPAALSVGRDVSRLTGPVRTTAVHATSVCTTTGSPRSTTAACAVRRTADAASASAAAAEEDDDDDDGRKARPPQCRLLHGRFRDDDKRRRYRRALHWCYWYRRLGNGVVLDRYSDSVTQAAVRYGHGYNLRQRLGNVRAADFELSTFRAESFPHALRPPSAY